MDTVKPTSEQWNERTSATGAALRDTGRMFQLFFERTADAVWLFDPAAGVICDCNAAAVALMGCANKLELTGKRPDEIAATSMAEDKPPAVLIAEQVEVAMRTGSSRFEWTVQRGDGAQVPLETNATLIPFADHSLLLFISRDITDRKKAENEIRQLNASLEKHVAGRTVELVLANEQLKGEIAERKRQEKVQRATFQISEAVHTADDLPSFYARIHAIMQTLMPARNFFIALFDQATEIITFPYFVDEKAQDWPRPRPVGKGLTGVVLRTGRPLLVSRSMCERARKVGDAIILDGTDVPFVEIGVPAAVWLGAPLTSLGNAIGVMTVQDYADEAAYGESEKQILTFVAEQTALAVLRKRSEQALRDSEAQHRALFEATSQGVMLHDEKAFCRVNPAAVRILGHASEATLIGKHPAELSPPNQPDGTDSATAAKRQIDKCLAQGSARFEWLMNRPDGTVSTLDVLLTAMELGGRKMIQAVVDDITERKRAEAALRVSEARLRESEARFSTAFRASPVLITMSRLSDRRFVEANDAFLRWIGMERHEILGKTSQELGLWVNDDERTGFLSKLGRSGTLREVECQLRNHRGGIYTMLLSAEIIEINREPHLLIFRLDVTQRKQAETELLRTLAREKELGQLRSDFVSMVSHEFRTPLGIIQSSAEILEDYLDRLEPEERKEHLQSISKNTRRMAGMMEEVLLIGRLEAGKMDFKPEAVDLGCLARRITDEVLSATTRRCPVELTVGELPAEVRADERLLRHIFTNLLGNAVKYSEAGETVRFAISREGNDAVCVIKDRGIGIPEADHEWLFNAFHRGRNVGERAGTGLGLVIVKRCADLHGATLKIESKVGEGTAVTVRLPVFQKD